MSGFYLMHRGWQEADIFAREEYSRRDAWVWLIEACCFRLTDNENLAFASNVSGTVMSIKSMSKRLLWRRTKVAHFLQDISSSDTFSVKFIGNDVCHVTLLNWREYVDSLSTEQIGRAHVLTPVTTAHPVCNILI